MKAIKVLILFGLLIGMGFWIYHDPFFQRLKGKFFPDADEKSAPDVRLTSRFSGSPDNFRLNLTLHKTPGELKNVNVTVTVLSLSGEQTTLTQVWDSWKKDEEKTLALPATVVKSVVVAGKASQGSKEIKLENTFTFGGEDRPYPMPRLDYKKFDLVRPTDATSKVFQLRNNQPYELKSLDLTISVTTRTGSSQELKLSRALWPQGGTIPFELPEPNFQKLVVNGTATVQGKPVRIHFTATRDED